MPAPPYFSQNGKVVFIIMTKEKDSLISLKEVLSDLFASGEIPFNLEDAKIWRIWEETVGRGISEHACPAWIKEGILRVDVSDPIWCQEIQYSEKEIRKRINQQLGRNAVKRIEFKSCRRYESSD